MPTATLKEAEEKLGLSPDDTVQYEEVGEVGNEAIIKIQLHIKEKVGKKKKTAKELFDWIVENGEHMGITDWAENHDHYLYGTPKRKKGE
jgi:hypothetical protein